MRDEAAAKNKSEPIVNVVAVVIQLALIGFVILTPPIIYAVFASSGDEILLDAFGNFFFALVIELVLAAAGIYLYFRVTAQKRARRVVRFRHPDRVPIDVHDRATATSLAFARNRLMPRHRRAGTSEQENLVLLYNLGFALLFIVGLVVGIVSCGVLMVPFWLIFHRFRKRANSKLAALTSPTADMVRAVDNRAPVLLLRSFGDDQIPCAAWRRFNADTVDTFEDLLEAYLCRCGPLIAIGRPGEELPPTGAAREYLAHGAWQDRVTQLLQQARLVVMVAGTSEGVTWEFDQLVRNDALAKTVILFPPRSEREIELCWNHVSHHLASHVQDQALNDTANGIIALAFRRQMPVLIDGEFRNGEEYIVALDRALAIADLSRTVDAEPSWPESR